MLKEIEGSKKLKHVECNDRSKPLLPKAKEKGQFLYDSERSNVHNELLKQVKDDFVIDIGRGSYYNSTTCCYDYVDPTRHQFETDQDQRQK